LVSVTSTFCCFRGKSQILTIGTETETERTYMNKCVAVLISVSVPETKLKVVVGVPQGVIYTVILVSDYSVVNNINVNIEIIVIPKEICFCAFDVSSSLGGYTIGVESVSFNLNS